MWILALLGIGLALLATSPDKSPPDRPMPSPDPDQVEQLIEFGPYTIRLYETEAGWAWQVYATPAWKTRGAGGTALAGQHAGQHAQAQQDALDWIAGQVEGGPKVGGGSPGGGGGGPSLQGGPGDVGLTVAADCSTVKVSAIARWLAWATPRVQQIDWRNAPEAGALVLEQLAKNAVPQCVGRDDVEIGGRTVAQVVAGLDHVIQKWRDAELVSVEEPDEILAARAMASSVPKRDGYAELRDRAGQTHLIVVDREPGTSDYRWRFWIGRRQGKAQMVGSGQTLQEALVKARGAVDTY